MSFSRWIIDDTTEPGRIFCEHTAEPRLKGELLPFDLRREGDALPAPDNRVLANIQWLEDEEDGIYYEAQDMYDSLEVALKDYEAAKAPALAR